MNQNIANFKKNSKPASIEDKTNKEENVSQNDVVILSGSSDEDSFFVCISMELEKKKKAKNVKQTENMLML